jgi:hypothetical protein
MNICLIVDETHILEAVDNTIAHELDDLVASLEVLPGMAYHPAYIKCYTNSNFNIRINHGKSKFYRIKLCRKKENDEKCKELVRRAKKLCSALKFAYFSYEVEKGMGKRLNEFLTHLIKALLRQNKGWKNNSQYILFCLKIIFGVSRSIYLSLDFIGNEIEEETRTKGSSQVYFADELGKDYFRMMAIYESSKFITRRPFTYEPATITSYCFSHVAIQIKYAKYKSTIILMAIDEDQENATSLQKRVEKFVAMVKDIKFSYGLEVFLKDNNYEIYEFLKNLLKAFLRENNEWNKYKKDIIFCLGLILGIESSSLLKLSFTEFDKI